MGDDACRGNRGLRGGLRGGRTVCLRLPHRSPATQITWPTHCVGPASPLLYTLFFKNKYIYVSSLYYILKPRLIILLPQSREFDIFNIEKNKLELNLSLLLTFDRIFFSFFQEEGKWDTSKRLQQGKGEWRGNGQWSMDGAPNNFAT